MNLRWDKQEDIEQLSKALNQKEVVVTTGDTVLGLMASLTQQGYDRINEIKQRAGKPHLLLIGSKQKLSHFVDQELSKQTQQIINAAWPGPVTLIFKAKKDLPSYMKAENGTIAVRVPDHKGLLQLLQSHDGLFSTSANIHKEPVPATIDLLDYRIKEKIVATCVDSFDALDSIPSTILDCSSGQVKVIRAGEALKHQLKNFII